MNAQPPERLPVLGWREWCSLPDLGVPRVKAKIDTGARSSSLHAFDVEMVKRSGQWFVRFKVHPRQRHATNIIAAEAEVLEVRSVRSSNGEVADRPVIVTHVELLGERWPIELTLANRDAMGFRMLLGREALRRRFLVDAGRSYLAGRRDTRTPADARKSPEHPAQ
ncbi:MAG: ATP-dependent zinc protease [Planctomycetaceae bacterium]